MSKRAAAKLPLKVCKLRTECFLSVLRSNYSAYFLEFSGKMKTHAGRNDAA